MLSFSAYPAVSSNELTHVLEMNRGMKFCFFVCTKNFYQFIFFTLLRPFTIVPYIMDVLFTYMIIPHYHIYRNLIFEMPNFFDLLSRQVSGASSIMSL